MGSNECLVIWTYWIDTNREDWEYILKLSQLWQFSAESDTVSRDRGPEKVSHVLHELAKVVAGSEKLVLTPAVSKLINQQSTVHFELKLCNQLT